MLIISYIIVIILGAIAATGVNAFIFRLSEKKASVPMRVQCFLVGCVTVAIFLLFYGVFGVSAVSVINLVFALALLVVAVIDVRERLIPDEISLIGILAGLALSVIYPGLHGELSWMQGLRESLVGMLAGGGFLYLSGVAAEWVLKKEAIGGGDIKLLAMIGAFLGWQGVLWTVFISSLTGSVAGLWARFARGEAYFPYGPYLALGAFLYLFFGPAVMRSYFH